MRAGKRAQIIDTRPLSQSNELSELSPARVLLADDSRTVRDSVVGVLSALPHVHVTCVENGAQALKEACAGHYSLLLSDIEMPVMNGLQLLRMLRQQFFSGAELPVIMLTSLDHAEQKARAFADGANDYVTKPVEPLELLARVKAQLQLRALHRENLANQALSSHAQKLAAVAQLSATLAHELNTPAQYLGDNLEFLTRSLKELEQWLLQSPLGKLPDELAYLHEEIPSCLGDMRAGVERISKLVATITEFADPNPQRTASVDVERSIHTVIDLLRSRWLGVVELTTDLSAPSGTVHCCPTDLKHALWQVISQAIDDAATPGAKKGAVEVASAVEPEHVVVSVRATRPALRAADTTRASTDDALRITNAVLSRHRAELVRNVEADGTTVSVIKLVR